MSSTLSAERSAIAIEDPALGRVAMRRLDWDSDFFGGRFGAVDPIHLVAGSDRAAAAGALLGALLSKARDDGYEHLIFRVAGDDSAAVQGAERAGFRLVDVGVDFVYRFDYDVRRPRPTPPGVRTWREGDVEALQDMAGTVFTFSRFQADPHFTTTQVQAFHRQWIANLCHGLAREVLVYEAGNGPAGFVSCAVDGDQGRIPLIASAATHRRRGVGRALVDGALDWFRAAGAREVYVKTQASNVPAVNLYERAGFVLGRCELTFSCSLARPATNEGGIS